MMSDNNTKAIINISSDITDVDTLCKSFASVTSFAPPDIPKKDLCFVKFAFFQNAADGAGEEILEANPHIKSLTDFEAEEKRIKPLLLLGFSPEVQKEYKHYITE
jgi:hypothetical protein